VPIGATLVEGQHYYVSDLGCFNFDAKKPKRVSMAQWHDLAMMHQMTEFVQEKILRNVDEDRIKLFTCAKVDGNIYRAKPNHQSPYEKGWHDWAQVPWLDPNDEVVRTVPQRIVIYIEIPLLSRPIELNDQEDIFEAGLYAIVQSTSGNLDHYAEELRAHGASQLIGKDSLVLDKADKHPQL